MCACVSFQGLQGCCSLGWSHSGQTGDRWEGAGVPAGPGNGSGVRSRKGAGTLRWEPTSCLSVASVASSAAGGGPRAPPLRGCQLLPPQHDQATPWLRPATGHGNILTSLYSGWQVKKKREEIPEVCQASNLLGGYFLGHGSSSAPYSLHQKCSSEGRVGAS